MSIYEKYCELNFDGSWINLEKREENIAAGKLSLEKELRRNNISFSEKEYEEYINDLARRMRFADAEEFYAAIGYGGFQLWKVMPRLKEEYQKAYASNIEEIELPQAPQKRHKASSGVIIEGTDDVLVKFSNCCNPLPGDIKGICLLPNLLICYSKCSCFLPLQHNPFFSGKHLAYR